jgi:hypothetical protein
VLAGLVGERQDADGKDGGRLIRVGGINGVCTHCRPFRASESLAYFLMAQQPLFRNGFGYGGHCHNQTFKLQIRCIHIKFLSLPCGYVSSPSLPRSLNLL